MKSHVQARKEIDEIVRFMYTYGSVLPPTIRDILLDRKDFAEFVIENAKGAHKRG